MFCPNCGKELPNDARFCGSCGMRLAAVPMGGGAGKSISPAAQAQGRSPGRSAEKTAARSHVKVKGEAGSEKPSGRAGATGEAKSAAPEKKAAAARRAVGAAAAKAGETVVSTGQDVLSFTASPEGGEMALGTLGSSLPEMQELVPGPLKVIGSSLKSFFSSLAAAVRNPRVLIPALVLAVLWLALDILKARGVEPGIVKVLSFLSFANGGMEGGAAGLIGGLLGKGLFAGAVTSVVGSFTRKGSEKRGLGNTLKGGFGFAKETLWSWLTGIGAALLLYLFISGGALKMAFMAGAAAAYLAVRAAVHNGFLKKLLSSFTSRGKAQAGPGAAGFLRGMALGFAAAALLALAEKRLALLIPGIVLLLGGGVMLILQAAKAEKQRD